MENWLEFGAVYLFFGVLFTVIMRCLFAWVEGAGWLTKTRSIAITVLLWPLVLLFFVGIALGIF